MTRQQKIIVALAALVVLAASGAGLYWAGVQHGKTVMGAAGSAANAKPGDKIDPATGRRILYWHDPMVPGQKFDKPGRSPFMDMDLVPVYAAEADGQHAVAINPGVQQNLGIRTAEVTKGSLAAPVEAVGNVSWNERDVAVVQARGSGYLERVYVRTPLEPVRKGQPLAEFYVPDWVAAQEDYLAARRMHDAGVEGLADAARQRMRLAGMTDAQIRVVETSGKVHPRLTVVAPETGVVAGLEAREGMTVAAGAPLYRINGLATVWIDAQIPESAVTQARPGTAVEAHTAALPGKVFHGTVAALLPEVDPGTRTLKARIELPNPSGLLMPGMFANVSLTPAQGQPVLLVPSDAVIQTGQRSLVFIAAGGGKFEPVEVETGTEANGQTEVRKGLQVGQKVVASGQFLVDSEASLRGALARMGETKAPAQSKPAPKAAPVHQGVGKIEQISPDEVTLSHGPIPTLHWGPMTMGFKPPAGGLPNKLRVGDTVTFEIRALPDGQYQITAITRTAATPSTKPAPVENDR
jgi:membrane fusion protein, copper/silver efflux system